MTICDDLRFNFSRATSGRIILRQGHVGVNFYFIYSGSVFVNINDTNMYGNQFVKTEAVLKRGDSFGVRFYDVIWEKTITTIFDNIH